MTLRSRVENFRSRTIQEKKRNVIELAWRRRKADQRRALLAGDKRLRMIRTGDQILPARVVDHFTSQSSTAANLEIVTSALEAADIPYFLVPGVNRVRYTVGLAESDRSAFLRSLLRRQGASAVYIARPKKGNDIMHAMVCADGAVSRVVAEAEVLRVGELGLSPAGQLLSGPELGCDVEFWKDGGALLASPEGEQHLAAVQPQASEEVFAESLIAPRPNRIADVLPKGEQKPTVLRIRDREVRTYEAFTRTTSDDVDFPIDVVYTWVDGDEPDLRAKRAAYKGEITQILDKETNSSRYTSHDELKYSIRSLEMYAPFVRNVYIVTDGQTPAWLDTSQDRVKVIDHRDIFPEGVLPVFNSHAIETRLHHIPGLSEHYLYLNDDVFFGRSVNPQQFFYGNGIIKVPVSPLKIGLGESHANETATNSASKNVRVLLEGLHGRFTTNNFMHTPLPQRRDVLLELEEIFPEKIEQTMRSRFRSSSDIALTAPMHYYQSMLTGRGIPSRFSFRYVNVSREDADLRLADLQATRRFDFFCLNEVDVPEEARDEVHQRMINFLDRYFPFPSSVEKD